jgi:hypothetical protein
MAVLTRHRDSPEQPGDHHRVSREGHQRALVLRGGDEPLAAVHVSSDDDGGGRYRADDDQNREESPRHLRRAELANFGSDES